MAIDDENLTYSIPHRPQVSVGMPVYNGEHFIREALDSLLAQTFRDFELIISDNASIDETEKICREYASKDSRIRYVRQPKNRGGVANFQFVLDEAVGEYFMWAAADDSWAPTFIDKNLSLLREGGAIASISRVGFKSGGAVVKRSRADSAIKGTAIERLRKFLRNPSDNSRFYSLYCRRALRSPNLFGGDMVAADWYLVAIILLEGDFVIVDELLMYRTLSHKEKYLKSLDARRVERIFPLLPFSIALARRLSLQNLLSVLHLIALLNIVKSLEMLLIKVKERVCRKKGFTG